MQSQTGPTRPAIGRGALVLRLLLDALPSLMSAQHQPEVLDCGGGSGTFAVPLAEAGATVTVVDISADALATLQRRALEAGVAEAVREISGDVEKLPGLLSGRQFDLVLAHGILDAVENLDATFAHIAAAVRPGGFLSLLVRNPSATVLGHALVGELDLALVELRELDARPGADPATIGRLCAQHGLVIEFRHGIGAFSDVVPGAAIDSPAARETLAQLDFEAAGREPFASLAARAHLLARRRPG